VFIVKIPIPVTLAIVLVVGLLEAVVVQHITVVTLELVGLGLLLLIARIQTRFVVMV